MFVLESARVHYGVNSYPLTGLPSWYDEVESVDDLDPEILAYDVGRLTSFTRPFTIKLIPALHMVLGRKGYVLDIPEHIFASANGYSIRWNRR